LFLVKPSDRFLNAILAEFSFDTLLQLNSYKEKKVVSDIKNVYLRGIGASKHIILTQDGYFVAKIDTIVAPIEVPTRHIGSPIFNLSNNY